MTGKMQITDERMLSLPQLLKSKGKVVLLQDVWDTIGFHRQNLPNIKSGHQHFTAAHLTAMVTSFGVNANYIHGTSEDAFVESPIRLRKIAPKIVNRKVNSKPQKSTKKKVTRK